MTKVHKDQVPLRPVVSMVGKPKYNLAKCFDQLKKTYIPDAYFFGLQTILLNIQNNSQSMVTILQLVLM